MKYRFHIAVSVFLTLLCASCGTSGSQPASETTDTSVTTAAAETTAEVTTTTSATTTAASVSAEEESSTANDSSSEQSETSASETKRPVVESKIVEDGDELSPYVTTKTEEFVAVEEEEETVSISLSSMMVSNDPQGYINSISGEDGVISAAANDSGGVDMVLTKKRYTETCDTLRQTCKNIIDNMPEKNNYTTITAFSYNDDLSDIYVTVTDYDAYLNSMDGFFKMQISVSAGMYHNYAQDGITTTIHYLDQSGNEVASEALG